MTDPIPTANAGTVKPYKRSIRNIMIHKPLQREYLFVVIALLMVSMLAVGFVIHGTIREAAFGSGFHFGKISPYQVLSDVSYNLVMRVSLILLATLVVLAVFGMSFLHRVAGPVYRFRMVLRRVNAGEKVGLIQLREGDFFTETADEINALIQKIDSEKHLRDTLQEKLEMIVHSRPAENVMKLTQEMQGLIVKEEERQNAPAKG
jgi:hypothetical protein